MSKVVFDAFRGRLRQSNAALDRNPTQTVTNIGKWGLPTPQEWDVTTGADGSVSCTTEPLPPVMCPNGTLPPSCPPKFGSWGGLNPFTSILGMWYPNTTKVTGGLSASYDTYLLVDVKRTLLPNDGCGTSACTMQHCSGCMHDGRACTQCPCDNCIMEVNVTRNYTYNVAKTPQADGSHQLIRCVPFGYQKKKREKKKHGGPLTQGVCSSISRRLCPRVFLLNSLVFLSNLSSFNPCSCASVFLLCFDDVD